MYRYRSIFLKLQLISLLSITVISILRTFLRFWNALKSVLVFQFVALRDWDLFMAGKVSSVTMRCGQIHRSITQQYWSLNTFSHSPGRCHPRNASYVYTWNIFNFLRYTLHEWSVVVYFSFAVVRFALSLKTLFLVLYLDTSNRILQIQRTFSVRMLHECSKCFLHCKYIWL